ncbi:hypothetical protein [Streptosporangium sp. G11]|uniref:hypothetical protein n=1 Tax=Streptosporangium sp. G11 TaxID=3436926 RepID=UPI003EC0B43B
MPLARTASISLRKSSIQDGTTAYAATGALPIATFQPAVTASWLIREPRFSSRL